MGEIADRQDPARDGPIRDFPHYARNHGMGGSGRPATDDPVSHGVKLGYSVLEEQMREGQRLAERLRGGMSGAAPLDVGVLIERALNIYRDIGALAFAATEALARNPALTSGLGRATAAPAPEPQGSGPAAAANYTLDVQSTRRVSVKLDLRPSGRAHAVGVGALHAAEGAARPISDVRLEGDPAAPTLRLTIDDDQPAGLYHGVVVDAATREARGTLTVHILG